MRKPICAGFLAILIAAALCAGIEPWKSKPYTQWDEKDVAAVLESSPWAKANVLFAGPSAVPLATGVDNTAANSPTGGAASHVNPASATAPPQLEGASPENATAPSRRYSVFWASSRTIRAASARRAVLKGIATPQAAAKLAEAAPDSYQILINSQDMSIFEKRGEEALKSATFLELRKGKKKISPAGVVFQKSSGKVVGVIFSFSKTDVAGAASIPADEKEVEFIVRLADSQLRTTFNLKQMSDMQGQDL